MANTSKQQILTLHTSRGELYNAATEQQQNIIQQVQIACSPDVLTVLQKNYYM